MATGADVDAPPGPLDLSVVVACYNAAPYLRQSIGELVSVLELLRYRGSYEIVFVDDASTDGTLAVIEELQQAYPGVATTVITHRHNMGRGRTVTDGLLAARGRMAGFLDIDLETPAHYIAAAALAIEGGADVATAWRIYKLLPHSLGRQILSLGYHALEAHILRVPLHDTETGFKFFNRARILPVLAACHDRGWFWDTEIMARSYFGRLRIVEIPTLFCKRDDKKSTVRLLADSRTYLRQLLRFRAEARRLEVRCRAYQRAASRAAPDHD